MKVGDVMPTMGQLMKAKRKLAGLTQEQVAEKMGVKRATYAQYEAGNRVPLTMTLAKIAHAIGCKMDDLIPIDEQIETAQREIQSTLWAAETLARDNGKPWDVSTYNQERERVILDMSRRYSVAPEILFAFIPQRTDDEYSKGAIWIDSTPVGSAKNKARYLFNSLQSDVQKKAAVQIAIDDLWGKYKGNPIPVFEEIWNVYKDNDAAAIKLAEDLEALAYSSDKK